MVFLFFQFFCYFFRNFLAWVEYERNSGVKYFSLFPGLSHPVLARNNVGKRFFNFFNLFTIFSGIFLPESSMIGIRKQNFIFLFLGLSHPILAKNNVKKLFLDFFNFFTIFFGIFLAGSSMNDIRE